MRLSLFALGTLARRGSARTGIRGSAGKKRTGIRQTGHGEVARNGVPRSASARVFSFTLTPSFLVPLLLCFSFLLLSSAFPLRCVLFFQDCVFLFLG